MRFLGISGSLRKTSSNTAVLQAASLIAPDGVAITTYDKLGLLPHFNPDLEQQELPALVTDLRRRVSEADGLLICSPEYAHGIPGSMKNALDWLVGSIDFAGKPVAAINIAPRAHHAHAQMIEILTTMAAQVVDSACVVAPPRGLGGDAAGMIADPRVTAVIEHALAALVEAAAARRHTAIAL